MVRKQELKRYQLPMHGSGKQMHGSDYLIDISTWWIVFLNGGWPVRKAILSNKTRVEIVKSVKSVP